MHGRGVRPGTRCEYGQASLPVATLPTDFDGVPLNGEQYLAMVRREANLQPSILYSAEHVERPSIAAAAPAPSVPALPTGFVPSARWRSVFLQRYERLHQVLSIPPPDASRVRLPAVSDEAAWFCIIHGRKAPSADEKRRMTGEVDESDAFESASESAVDGTVEQVPTGDPLIDDYGFVYCAPQPRTVAALDTSDTLQLIQYIRKWTQQLYFTRVYEDTTLLHAMHPHHAQWLFALLAHLDRRLLSEEIAGLRALGRTCITLLVNYRAAHARNTYMADTYDPQRESGAWMLLTIVAGVYGQRDLWDEAKARTSTELDAPRN
ncbi:hypothetical protein MBRA1_002420 [Malassezia brasiliensis]|uniref:Uncharacterized protein n=1 Tax=Malassezia brasiliensis TaxID=1821822 RepID=A0AAF0DU42_9BASI|nr:hypothetical protein MBRA1_002420 [Malassezia brasiliensis]